MELSADCAAEEELRRCCYVLVSRKDDLREATRRLRYGTGTAEAADNLSETVRKLERRKNILEKLKEAQVQMTMRAITHANEVHVAPRLTLALLCHRLNMSYTCKNCLCLAMFRCKRCRAHRKCQDGTALLFSALQLAHACGWI